MRPNLSDDLVDTVRGLILSGKLAPEQRINEVQLSTRLEVSRTPLREALGRLAQEGSLTSSARRGWFVPPLSAAELKQIYPIRSYLDPEALRASGLPGAERLETLEDLNRQFAQASDAVDAISLDDRWHRELVAACQNLVLLALIERFRSLTHRYELALLRERTAVAASAADHSEILAALHQRDLDGACSALRRNLESGLEPLLSWLAERARRTGSSV